MKIAVIGTGYVGLVTGTCLAEVGHDVVCMDVDKDKVARLKQGDIPIYEPGLADLVHKNHQAGRLQFTTKHGDLVEAQAIFFALPTPPAEDGSADLHYILEAAQDVAKIISHYTVFINKSTVPVGTAKQVREAAAKHTKVPFDVVSNPEFLQEGLAIAGFMTPDRIVVGTSSSKAQEVMEAIYQPLTSQGARLFVMDEASAELTKYAANSFLATKVSFMNEIANLCERVGANIDSVKQGIGTDKRIGLNFLNAGVGYGGSCFPKDILALETVARQHDSRLQIIEAARQVNEQQKEVMVTKVTDRFSLDLSSKVLAVWGLAFKPNTDDVRQSPALHIIQRLRDLGAKVQAFDPEATHNAQQVLGDTGIVYTKHASEALQGADALLIVTEWEEFSSINPEALVKYLKAKTVFDGRNLFEPAAMAKAGLTYISIGRQDALG
jgi:UDPglucose 6-dehydrogenase